MFIGAPDVSDGKRPVQPPFRIKCRLHGLILASNGQNPRIDRVDFAKAVGKSLIRRTLVAATLVSADNPRPPAS
jgi:hypothetical protein